MANVSPNARAATSSAEEWRWPGWTTVHPFSKNCRSLRLSSLAGMLLLLRRQPPDSHYRQRSVRVLKSGMTSSRQQWPLSLPVTGRSACHNSTPITDDYRRWRSNRSSQTMSCRNCERVHLTDVCMHVSQLSTSFCRFNGFHCCVCDEWHSKAVHVSTLSQRISHTKFTLRIVNST